MKVKILICTLLVLSVGRGVWAQDDAHRKLAEELLTLMDVQKNIEQAFDSVRQMQRAQLSQMNVSGADAAKAEIMQARVMDLIQQELSWDRLKDDYISVYADTFTDEELKGIIEFYKGPIGHKFIQKMPDVMKRSMEISQKQMMSLTPKIQALTKELSSHPALPPPGVGPRPAPINDNK